MDNIMLEPAQQILMPSPNISTSYPDTLHILSGSFRSLSLFLLAFSPARRTLSLVQQAQGFGPHQYVSVGPKHAKRKNQAFTTSWAVPPILSSWEISESNDNIIHVSNTPITAVSSYITLPKPYTHLYSVGGPTGEVHFLPSDQNGFGNKVQEVLFLESREQLEKADKTRKALRYGSHGIEFSGQMAFVPVLGTNSIEVYAHDSSSGLLTHIHSSSSPRPNAHDGPRHVKIHPNGKVLYCVTEHTNLLDVYSISTANPGSDANPLTYISTQSLLPSHLSYPHADNETVARFRGDTLTLSFSEGTGLTAPTEIWATTRGATEADRGWVSVFRLDGDGMFMEKDLESQSESKLIERYETPTSGGKAHAIDLYPKDFSFSSSGGTPVWILLTDDSDYAAGETRENESTRSSTSSNTNANSSNEPVGAVRVLEWDGWETGGVREVIGWPTKEGEGEASEYYRSSSGKKGEESELMRGGSHAVWLEGIWDLD